MVWDVGVGVWEGVWEGKGRTIGASGTESFACGETDGAGGEGAVGEGEEGEEAVAAVCISCRA